MTTTREEFEDQRTIGSLEHQLREAREELADLREAAALVVKRFAHVKHSPSLEALAAALGRR